MRTTFTMNPETNPSEPKISTLGNSEKTKENELLILVLASKDMDNQISRHEKKVCSTQMEAVSVQKIDPPTPSKAQKIAFAGIVIQTGDFVTKFKVGDEVIGYTLTKKKGNRLKIKVEEIENLAPKPGDQTFEGSIEHLVNNKDCNSRQENQIRK